MVLKRKRSSSDLGSSPSCASSTSSSPPRQNAFNFNAMPAFTRPSSQSGRTMKRLRNNRPTENLVHQRTLGLLYSAQQRSPHVQEMMDDAPMETPSTTQIPSPQQSLHRFWNISTPPVSSPAVPQQMISQSTNCDDCGNSLGASDDGMDVDGYAEDDSSCGACGKHVCFSCSVSNLGEQRRCLHCAGRQTGTGAITGYFANAGVSGVSF